MSIPPDLLERVDKLDPLPITTQRLSKAMAREDTSLAEVAQIVEYDQAVAAGILRFANSPLYAGLLHVVDVRDAVVRLGMNTVLCVVLGDYLKHIATSAPLYGLNEDDLWLHGAMTSLALGEIREAAPSCPIPPEAAVAALVHDIGKLVIGRHLKADAELIRHHAKQHAIPFVAAEREVLGYDHAEVGALIARQWRFPDDIARCIGDHHQVPVADPTPALDAVILADLVTKAIGIGLGSTATNFEFDQGVPLRLGIDDAAFEGICARTVTHVAALKAAYDLDR
jgi:putative nucleotidyltransferase with HDIG domain